MIPETTYQYQTCYYIKHNNSKKHPENRVIIKITFLDKLQEGLFARKEYLISGD